MDYPAFGRRNAGLGAHNPPDIMASAVAREPIWGSEGGGLAPCSVAQWQSLWSGGQGDEATLMSLKLIIFCNYEYTFLQDFVTVFA